LQHRNQPDKSCVLATYAMRGYIKLEHNGIGTCCQAGAGARQG